MGIAAEKKDISICNNLPGEEEQKEYGDYYDTRKARCFGGVAAAKQDNSTCETIEIREIKDWCYSLVSDIDEKNLSNFNYWIEN